MSQLMTTKHQWVNRYLITKGCVSEDELDDMYRRISTVFRGRRGVRMRRNSNEPDKSELDQIIEDINNYMRFMHASIVTCDYDLNDTRYYVYQLAIDQNQGKDDIITKQCMTKLPLPQMRLFKKIVNLCLLNNGLISFEAICALNEEMSKHFKESEVISMHQMNDLLAYLCKSGYLFKLGEDKAQNSYCIGPRSLVGLQAYIDNKEKKIENLRACPMCMDLMIGWGMKCDARGCRAGIYHAKCVEQLSQSRQCANCQKKWDFDPCSKVALLSDPKLSEDMIGEAMKGSDDERDGEEEEEVVMNGHGNNHNHNGHGRNGNTVDDDDDDEVTEDDDGDRVMISQSESQSQSQLAQSQSQSQSQPQSQSQSQSQRLPPRRRRRRRNVVGHESETDSE